MGCEGTEINAQHLLPGRSLSDTVSLKYQHLSKTLSGGPFLWFVSLGMQRNEHKINSALISGCSAGKDLHQ